MSRFEPMYLSKQAATAREQRKSTSPAAAPRQSASEPGSRKEQKTPAEPVQEKQPDTIASLRAKLATASPTEKFRISSQIRDMEAAERSEPKTRLQYHQKLKAISDPAQRVAFRRKFGAKFGE